MINPDFTKPAAGDAYTNWPPEIVALVTALAAMLDPNFVTPSGTLNGSKRLNGTNGLFEILTGGSWVKQVMGYLETANTGTQSVAGTVNFTTNAQVAGSNVVTSTNLTSQLTSYAKADGSNVSGTWSALSIGGTSAYATNVAGGGAGQLLYQSVANTTAKLAAGTAGYVLQMVSGFPAWVAQSSLSVGSAATATSVSLAALATALNGAVTGNANGLYITIPMNGITAYIQCGFRTLTGPSNTTTYNFPIAFPNAVSGFAHGQAINAYTGSPLNFSSGGGQISTSQYQLRNGDGSASTVTYGWIAIGY